MPNSKVVNIIPGGYVLRMKYDKEKFRAIIAEEVRKAGSPEKLAKRLDVAPNSVYNWEKGKNKPFDSTVVEICQKLGIEPPTINASKSSLSKSRPAEIDGFTMVPFLDVSLAAGDGAVTLDTEAQSHLAFQTQWLRSVGVPVEMAVVRVTGESMTPLIYDGDVVLIDASQNDALNGRIYAIYHEDHLRIKRVKTKSAALAEFKKSCIELGGLDLFCSLEKRQINLTGENEGEEPIEDFVTRVWNERYHPYALISDSKEYLDPEFVEKSRELHIVGRAVWIGRDISRQ